jgi:hypothetical protein
VAVTHLALAAHNRVLWPAVFAVLTTLTGLYLEYRVHDTPQRGLHLADQSTANREAIPLTPRYDPG